MEITIDLLVFVAGLLIGWLIKAWFSHAKGYGSKAGEIQAVDERLDRIEEQIKRTTLVAEDVKAEIGQRVEAKKVRREKLEELFTVVNRIAHATSGIIKRWHDRDYKPTLTEDGLRLHMLYGLYFPELSRPCADFFNAALKSAEVHSGARLAQRQKELELWADHGDTLSDQEVKDHGLAVLDQEYKKAIIAVEECTTKLTDLIKEVVATMQTLLDEKS